MFLPGMSEDVTDLFFLKKKDINAQPVGRRTPPNACVSFKNSNNFFFMYFQVKLVFKSFTSPHVLIPTNDYNLKPTCSCKIK